MTPLRICHYPRRDGKLPDGARWVGRPSRWGNPWTIRYLGGRYELWAHNAFSGIATSDQHNAHWVAVEKLYRSWIEFGPYSKDLSGWLDPLRDVTALACACPLHLPCHVDVLIELLVERQ